MTLCGHSGQELNLNLASSDASLEGPFPASLPGLYAGPVFVDVMPAQFYRAPHLEGHPVCFKTPLSLS